MTCGASYGAHQIDNSAKRNRFLAALPARDFSRLASHLRTAPLERSATLYDAGDEIEQVYFPLSGIVSLVAVMQNGVAVETAKVGRDGIVGATVGLGSRCAFGGAVVQIAGEAMRMAATQFREAVGNSDAIRALVVEYNDLLLGQIQQSAACNALHSLEGRLCRWLLEIGDGIGGNAIPMTQEIIAQMLGVRRTTLTVIARLLQGAEMIRYHRGLIQIIDRAKLQENACECYAVVKRSIDRAFPASLRRIGVSLMDASPARSLS
jgi:CRP-like cAMP-binding protein